MCGCASGLDLLQLNVHICCLFRMCCEVEMQCGMWGWGVGFQLR